MDAPTSRPPLRRALVAALEGEGYTYRLLFVLCAAFTVAPLWAGAVLPFQDYAGNMSYAAILRGAAEAGSLYDRTYETGAWYTPNGLLFFTWAWLGGLVGFLPAGKLLMSLYAVGLPLATERLLVAAGRDHRFALLAFPLVYNSNLIMGFASYCTGIPLAIYTLARAWRFREAPSWGRGVAVTALAMATFLGHAQTYMVLGILAFAFVLLSARSLRELLLLCAPFAASLLLFAPWAWESFVRPPDATALGGRPLQPFFQPPDDLFARWGEYTIARWSARFDDWIFLAMLGIYVLGIIDRRADRQPGEGLRRYALEGATLAVVVTYLVIPEHTVVQAAIGSRLVIFAMLLGLGWLHMPEAPRLRGAVVGVSAALAVTFGAHVFAAIRGFDAREMGPHFLPMIDALPDGSRLAVIVADGGTSYVRVHPHEHIYGYHFALNGGIAYSTFHSYYGRHAMWRPGEEVPWPGRRATDLLHSETACYYDYLLLRTGDVPRWRQLRSRVTYVDHSRAYSLWRIEHDRIPACRRKLQRDEGAEERVAGEAAPRPPADRAIAPTLSPAVGHARGRDLGGAWRSSTDARRRLDGVPERLRGRPAPPAPAPAAPPTEGRLPFGARPGLTALPQALIEAAAAAGEARLDAVDAVTAPPLPPPPAPAPAPAPPGGP